MGLRPSPALVVAYSGQTALPALPWHLSGAATDAPDAHELFCCVALHPLALTIYWTLHRIIPATAPTELGISAFQRNGRIAPPCGYLWLAAVAVAQSYAARGFPVIQTFFWVLVILGSIIGGLFLLYSFSLDGAPQQAAAAAVGVGFAVIPYCLARAITILRKPARVTKRITPNQ